MRIELVVDVPGVHNPDAVDAINLGNEVVRMVRNDTGDITASLIHAAVGSDIAVPADYDDAAPVVTVEPTDIVHDPSAITPHNEDAVHVAPFTPYNVGETTEETNARVTEDEAWDYIHAHKAEVDQYLADVDAAKKAAADAEAKDAADEEAARVAAEPVVTEDVSSAPADAEPVADEVTPEVVQPDVPTENPEADAALKLIAPPVETPEQEAYDANGTKD